MITPEQYNKRLKKAQESKNKAYVRHLNKQKTNSIYLEREALNTVRSSNRSGNHTNCFRYFKNNTKKHEIKKFQIYMQLIDSGHNVLVEPIFLNGLRADILDLTDSTIYEIINTESEESINKKERDYPFPIEVVRC